MKTKLHSTSEPIKRLRRLQQYGFNSAILAGGAVRDDFMEEAISDFDFFVWDPELSNELKSTPDPVKIYPKLFQATDFAQVMADTYGNHVNAMYEMRGDDLTTYQIIYTKINPIEHVNKFFDIGFCKAYCDVNRIRYTQDFLHDYKNKTLTIVGEEMTQDQFEYSVDYHIGKLKWKYPNHQLQVADHNKKLLDAYLSK